MADFKLTKIIEKKRNGEKLSDYEIGYFIDCVVKSVTPNAEIHAANYVDRSQIGAMLMAIYLKGLDDDETTEFVFRMKNSGYVFSWPEEWGHLVVDKHSTGGVGDKVSLILAPALAAVGLKVPMISGRSLAHTGGTLDKLESIPGFRASLTKEEIINNIHLTGCCIAGQTSECNPADKVLYQCREITATVTCRPLIVGSIVSKKLCEGTRALVYDVKYGKGSMFSTKEEAIETAISLVRFSKGVKASALLTSMENPLGKAIGNSVEVKEAIDCLNRKGPADVMQVTCALGSELLRLVQNTTREEGENMILEAIKGGKALEKFESMIIQQGVAPEIAKELCYGNSDSVLPETQYVSDIHYNGESGFIQEIDPLVLAKLWKEELIKSNNHPGVGLILLKFVGEKIAKGEAWVRVHHQSSEISNESRSLLSDAISVGSVEMRRVLIDKRIYCVDKSTIVKESYF